PVRLGDLITPERMDQPEDARITSFSAASSPGSRGIVAVGRRPGECARDCLAVFRSVDGGASWERLAARGITGSTLAVAPAFPDDPRIVALGPAGLSVSRDGGETFIPVASQVAGTTVAMAPGFSGPDQRVLLGGDPAWTYDDRTGVVVPLAGVSLEGWRSNFAFDPNYASSGLVLAGGAVQGPSRVEGAVFRCGERLLGDVCSESVVLPGLQAPPTVALLATGGAPLALASAPGATFVSWDGGRHFDAVPALEGLTVHGATTGTDGAVYAATTGRHGTRGLVRSVDAGRSWQRIATGTPLDDGVAAIASTPDGHLLATAAQAPTGLLCSTNGGRTWNARCGEDR
ncbi:MAG TPA: hypothetical protein VM618_04955, partial [Acidimicrobiia bacterium]|nr:hypothetical protein [Acidimicrobiia bacterium]